MDGSRALHPSGSCYPWSVFEGKAREIGIKTSGETSRHPLSPTVGRLCKEDMPMYGEKPALDGLSLVVCVQCGRSVKSQALLDHKNLYHSDSKFLMPNTLPRPLGTGARGEGLGGLQDKGGAGFVASKLPREKKASGTKEYDPDRHCGVWMEVENKRCLKSLTCKLHPPALKRSVLDRSRPFDELLASHQRKRELRKQKKLGAAAVASKPSPLSPPPPPKPSPGQQQLVPPPLATHFKQSKTVTSPPVASPVSPPPPPPPPPPVPLAPPEVSEGLPGGPSYPKPLAVCSFGCKRALDGTPVFGRRGDSLRLALNRRASQQAPSSTEANTHRKHMLDSLLKQRTQNRKYYKNFNHFISDKSPTITPSSLTPSSSSISTPHPSTPTLSSISIPSSGSGLHRPHVAPASNNISPAYNPNISTTYGANISPANINTTYGANISPANINTTYGANISTAYGANISTTYGANISPANISTTYGANISTTYGANISPANISTTYGANISTTYGANISPANITDSSIGSSSGCGVFSASHFYSNAVPAPTASSMASSSSPPVPPAAMEPPPPQPSRKRSKRGRRPAAAREAVDPATCEGEGGGEVGGGRRRRRRGRGGGSVELVVSIPSSLSAPSDVPTSHTTPPPHPPPHLPNSSPHQQHNTTTTLPPDHAQESQAGVRMNHRTEDLHEPLCDGQSVPLPTPDGPLPSPSTAPLHYQYIRSPVSKPHSLPLNGMVSSGSSIQPFSAFNTSFVINPSNQHPLSSLSGILPLKDAFSINQQQLSHSHSHPSHQLPPIVTTPHALQAFQQLHLPVKGTPTHTSPVGKDTPPASEGAASGIHRVTVQGGGVGGGGGRGGGLLPAHVQWLARNNSNVRPTALGFHGGAGGGAGGGGGGTLAQEQPSPVLLHAFHAQPSQSVPSGTNSHAPLRSAHGSPAGSRVISPSLPPSLHLSFQHQHQSHHHQHTPHLLHPHQPRTSKVRAPISQVPSSSQYQDAYHHPHRSTPSPSPSPSSLPPPLHLNQSPLQGKHNLTHKASQQVT